MKVAVVTQYFPTSHQPWAGHSAYQTLRPLARTCDLHVFYPEATYPAMVTPVAARRPPLDRTWSPPGVPVTYIPYPVLPVISRPLNGFVMESRLFRHVRDFRPDVIFNYVVYPDGYAAVRIARRLKVPVVLTAIGSDLNRISDRLCGALTRSALRKADVVTTVSRDLRNTAQTLGAKPADTQAILNGCDTAVFHPQDRGEARLALGVDPAAETIVYVGRLDVRKGLVELIEAAVKVRQKRPGLCCYIVGDGPDKPLLLETIARHDASAWISLVPSCGTAQVALWMASANLVTLPSYKEGCPNVILEALAAGRPVVATNVGGIPELMDDTCGRLIAVKDVGALVGGLDEVLGLGWNAAEIAAKHRRSWGDVADDVYRVLERAVGAARVV